MLARTLRGSFGTRGRWLTSPLGLVVLATAALRVVGLGWGLPASDGWDNDGIAPRDFLAGLVQTYTPGSYFTYPPAHLLLLGLLTAPITLVALARAPSLAPAAVVSEIVKVPYMTAIAYVARSVSLLMSLGIVVLVARLAEEIRGHELGVVPDEAGGGAPGDEPLRARVRAAGALAGACSGVNAILAYYGKTTNLDVPYLFWSLLALLFLTRAIARREPRRLRAFAVAAVLAVGTKDQAYAVFALSLPALLAAWLAFDPFARARIGLLAREAAAAFGIGVAVFLVLDAVVLNPTGFRARLAFLSGPASQDFAHYTNDWAGRRGVLVDMATHYPRYHSLWLAPAFALGLVAAVARAARAAGARGAKVATALAPLLASASFVVAFNFVARRTEHRFMLPQMTLLAVYGGLGLELVLARASRAGRVVAQAYASIAFAVSIFWCAAVSAQLVLDPRYEAEAWLRAHAREGDAIEVYGLNVYLPRFPEGTHVVRVGPEPVDRRNPLPGVLEVAAPFGDAELRRPRFVVVSEGWVWRYLLDPDEKLGGGRMLPPTQIKGGREQDGATFFQGLVRGQRGFREAHKATFRSAFWPRIDIHASTSREIWIYERRD